jgi:hypothetical protein
MYISKVNGIQLTNFKTQILQNQNGLQELAMGLWNDREHGPIRRLAWPRASCGDAKLSINIRRVCFESQLALELS